MDDEEKVSDVGEFALVDRIRGIVGSDMAIVGIGDDAAVLDMEGPDYVLASVDMLVDGVHFRLDDSDAFTVGQRSLAVNLSDIAAMGGTPTYALVSLALPPSLPATIVSRLYEGIREVASVAGVSVVGGNITRTGGPLCIDVAVLGRVARADVLRRDGAKVDDVVAVTGTLGNPAAARLTEGMADRLGTEWQEFRREYAVPRPRLHEAQALARSHLVHAAMDISDGLAGDIPHLATAGTTGFLIDAHDLPISNQARRIAQLSGQRAVDLALGGGEDYELLVILAPEALAEAQRLVAPLPLTPIGLVTPASDGLRIAQEDGRVMKWPEGGWKHF
ncbi:MAG: thiamine-phosphate kinase [Chloroflexota bacterium]